jgi:hypothetical protein
MLHLAGPEFQMPLPLIAECFRLRYLDKVQWFFILKNKINGSPRIRYARRTNESSQVFKSAL